MSHFDCERRNFVNLIAKECRLFDIIRKIDYSGFRGLSTLCGNPNSKKSLREKNVAFTLSRTKKIDHHAEFQKSEVNDRIWRIWAVGRSKYMDEEAPKGFPVCISFSLTRIRRKPPQVLFIYVYSRDGSLTYIPAGSVSSGPPSIAYISRLAALSPSTNRYKQEYTYIKFSLIYGCCNLDWMLIKKILANNLRFDFRKILKFRFSHSSEPKFNAQNHRLFARQKGKLLRPNPIERVRRNDKKLHIFD